MIKTLRTVAMAALAMVSVSAFAAWEKTTTVAVGDVVVLGTDSKEMTGLSTTSTVYGVVSDFAGTPAGTYPLTVVAGNEDGTFALQNADGEYLCWKSGNSLNKESELSANSSWNIAFDTDGTVDITNANTNERRMRYNASSPRIACYTSEQTDIYLWKQVADGAVVKPVIAPSAGLVFGATEVSITCDTEGAVIYYTVDGTEPTVASTKYTAAFTITETCTVKAIAEAEGEVSGVAEATYTVVNTEHAGTEADPFTVADAMLVIDAGGASNVFVKGIVQDADISVSSKQGIFYIADTEGESTDFQVYKVKGLNNADFTDGTVKAGDEVVICAEVKMYGEQYETTYGYIVSIVSEGPQAAGLAWSAATATVTIDADDNVFPTLTNPYDLAVAYSSSDETVATIDAEGIVTIIAAGETTIKAAFAGNDEYAAGEATYTLTVQEAQEPVAGVLFDFDTNGVALFGLAGTSSNDSHDGDITEDATATIDGVSVTVSASTTNTPNRLWNSSPALRMYSGTMTVSCNYPITEIVFEAKSGNFNFATTSGTLEGMTWTGEAKTIVFTCSKNTQIKRMTVVSTGQATAIETVQTAAVNNAAYNLAGQRVAEGYKGLVIKNGKKMLVK